MSAYEQSILQISTVTQLSLADGIALVHFMGLTNAARFVSLVDPWCYPGNQTPALMGVKRYLQAAVDKATSDGKVFHAWTADSMTANLLSPLLLPKGERPPLVNSSECKRGRTDRPAVASVSAVAVLAASTSAASVSAASAAAADDSGTGAGDSGARAVPPGRAVSGSAAEARALAALRGHGAGVRAGGYALGEWVMAA
jgi:hypothetical protein